MRVLRRIFPFVEWLPELLHPATLRADLVAGVTVALVLVPQSMAYAQLAGLPAYYGLYAAFLPPMIANLFGSSRQLATGPVAVVSLMTATALEPIATAGSQSFVAYAILLALLVGIFQLLLGVLRLGLVVNFLSHPVVNGFTNAAALIIATSQLSKIFGVQVEKAPHHYETVIRVVESALHWTHLPTLAMAVLAFAIMYGLRRYNPRLPNVLAAVLVTTLLSWIVGYERNATVSADRLGDHVAEQVEGFNTAVVQQRRLEELRSEGNQVFATIETSTVTFCQRCHPPRDVAGFQAQTAAGGEGMTQRTLALHQMAGLLDRHLGDVKGDVERRRTELRELAFRRADTDGGDVFYPLGQVPSGVETDGRRWRLKVGSQPLDPESLVLMGGGAVVGTIPRGLPAPKAPRFDATIIPKLIAAAMIISILGFMEAISIAKAMAAKTRQRLDPNQELIGQGLANIVGCCFQSYAVSGSFSRSAVNLQAGARTGMSNVFSSLVVVIVLLFLSPGLYHLPQAVLAAIIMMAVVGLLNVSGFVHAWRTKPFDGIVSVITFVGTLALAPHLEWGILAGVVLSLGGYLYRTMRPHVVRLVPVEDGTLRDAARHHLGSCHYISVIGFDGPLNFASTSYLEDEILNRVAEQPKLRYLLISGHGVTEVDASGEETLRGLIDRLRATGTQVLFAGLSDDVLDVLKRSHLLDRIGAENVFATEVRAVAAVYAAAHREGDEEQCPYRGVVPRLVELSLHPDGSLRDADRYRLPLCRHVAALRIDSPLNRASIRYVEEWVVETVGQRLELRSVIVVGHRVTSIDTEAAARLEGLVTELRRHDLEVVFSGLTDDVVDELDRAGVLESIGRDALFTTQAEAVAAVWPAAHEGSDEQACPLETLAPRLTELAYHPEGTLRDAGVHGLKRCRHLAVLRIDGPLPFASHGAMPSAFDRWATTRPAVDNVIFVGSALGQFEIRESEHLREFVTYVREQGFRVALANVPDRVAETLARNGIVDALGLDSFFASEPAALASMWSHAHTGHDEDACPLAPLLPRITELALHPDGSFRDAARYGLERCRHVAVLRFDGPLDYSTVGFFERRLGELLEGRPELRHVLIAGHTLGRIDAVAAEELVGVFQRLRERGLHVCISGLKDDVLEVLRRSGVEEAIGASCIFPTQAAALERLHPHAHEGSDEERCPLREVVESESVAG